MIRYKYLSLPKNCERYIVYTRDHIQKQITKISNLIRCEILYSDKNSKYGCFGMNVFASTYHNVDINSCIFTWMFRNDSPISKSFYRFLKKFKKTCKRPYITIVYNFICNYMIVVCTETEEEAEKFFNILNDVEYFAEHMYNELFPFSLKRLMKLKNVILRKLKSIKITNDLNRFLSQFIR